MIKTFSVICKLYTQSMILINNQQGITVCYDEIVSIKQKLIRLLSIEKSSEFLVHKHASID